MVHATGAESPTVAGPRHTHAPHSPRTSQLPPHRSLPSRHGLRSLRGVALQRGSRSVYKSVMTGITRYKEKKIFMLKKVKDTRILILTTPWHHIIWHNTRAWRGATSRYHKTTWHNTVTCFATTPEAATYHHLA